jgi:hypothetical protein
MKCPHTSFPRGKRIRVVFRNGEVIVAKFLEKRSRGMAVEIAGQDLEIPHHLIKSATIYRG